MSTRLGAVAGMMLATASTGCATTTTERLGLDPPQTAERVELSRYLGTWYEIASFPQGFQEGCTATTADYSLRDDGDIRVVNRCRRGSTEGELTEAHGVARVVDDATRAKLEVSFFRPFWGDYWILEHGDEYDYAVVGHPSRDYLWILARQPQMDSKSYRAILSRLKADRFDTTRLIRTIHQAAHGSPHPVMAQRGRK
jgi:apolipoprotein D and lipocalin family protein